MPSVLRKRGRCQLVIKSILSPLKLLPSKMKSKGLVYHAATLRQKTGAVVRVVREKGYGTRD